MSGGIGTTRCRRRGDWNLWCRLDPGRSRATCVGALIFHEVVLSGGSLPLWCNRESCDSCGCASASSEWWSPRSINGSAGNARSSSRTTLMASGGGRTGPHRNGRNSRKDLRHATPGLDRSDRRPRPSVQFRISQRAGEWSPRLEPRVWLAPHYRSEHQDQCRADRPIGARSNPALIGRV